MRVEGEPFPFVCVIWDNSEGGARVAVANPQSIPDEITLLLNLGRARRGVAIRLNIAVQT